MSYLFRPQGCCTESVGKQIQPGWVGERALFTKKILKLFIESYPLLWFNASVLWFNGFNGEYSSISQEYGPN